jgi:hypothetical protein
VVRNSSSRDGGTANSFGVEVEGRKYSSSDGSTRLGTSWSLKRGDDSQRVALSTSALENV